VTKRRAATTASPGRAAPFPLPLRLPRPRPLLVVALAVMLSACGIPQDRSPRPFERTQTTDLQPPRPASRDVLPASGQRVFFVAGVGANGAGRLVQVVRDVHATAREVLAELFKGPTDLERGRRVQTAIPTDTTLLDVKSEAADTIAVYLDNALSGTAGERQILAVAQIVYTVTALDGVRKVRILVNNAPREWPTEDGTPRSEPLTRFTYARFDPSTQPEFPPLPSPTGPSTATTFTVTSTSSSSTTIERTS
jgi:hypothetical protein